MRSFTARRRQATGEPIPFEVTYEVEVEQPTTVRQRERGSDDWTLQQTTQTVLEQRTERFVCKGEISALTLSELVHQGNVEIETVEGMAIVRQVLAGAFGDDKEYQRFFAFAQRHLDDEAVGDIFLGLIEDFAARPTQQPSASPRQGSTSTPDSTDGVVYLPGGYPIEAPTGS